MAEKRFPTSLTHPDMMQRAIHYIIIGLYLVLNICQITSAQSIDYYTTQAVSDSLVLERLHQHEEQARSATLRLLQEIPSPASARVDYTSSYLALPLVTHYPQGNRQGYNLPKLSISPLSLTNPSAPLLTLPKSWQTLGLQMSLRDNTKRYLQTYHLELFRYGQETLMHSYERIKTDKRKDTALEGILERKLDLPLQHNVKEVLGIKDIERKYWIPKFESSIQFSQNYISDNWYKGGDSNLNLYIRTYLGLTYSKDKITWLTELEDKLSLYSASPTEGRRYRIGEDQLRIRSNFGFETAKRLYYTLDAELRTQLFSTYNDKQTLIRSAFLSPLSTNVGLGMQYKYTYKSSKVYGRNLSFSLNVAPLSYTMRITQRKDIDLKRHGLTFEKPYYHRFGSTLRAQINVDFNLDLSWTSRFYANTSYSSTELEWENTLNMRFSRFFSTRINLHLRFDDTASPLEGQGWRKFIQVNELLSFGFNFKI